MKIRTVKYIVKEGAVNSYRNKLMSLASIFIVVAMLVIFGFFLLVVFNAELNINTLNEQPQLVAFCYDSLDDTQVQTVEDRIKNNDKVAEYEKVSRQQALYKFKEILGKDASILEGYDESIFPVSFIIKLKDNADSGEIVKTLEKTSGVEKVSYSQYMIDLVTKVSYWARLICSLLTVILLIIAVFIIANTIKLTVFARRKEINIMKYIGATDWFIRWPFVVEGVIIGTVGAILAFILTSYGYGAIEGKLTHDMLSLDTDLLKMVKLEDVWFQLTAFYLMIGIVVGSSGSFISIRRHLRV